MPAAIGVESEAVTVSLGRMVLASGVPGRAGARFAPLLLRTVVVNDHEMGNGINYGFFAYRAINPRR